MSIIEAHGGWEAWAALPTLRFDWVVERGGAEMFRVRHLWDRAERHARAEWPVGQDSTAVVILDLAASTPSAPVGRAFLNGQPSPPADSLLADGYSRWVNDSYWMVAPLKTFDPGVNRGLADDSSGTGPGVLAMSFGDVGLTPGDRYWLFTNAQGDIARWTYVLEGDTTASTWTWSEPATVQGPRGAVRFLTRKSKPDGTAIVTVPRDDLPADAWTSPSPILQ